MNSGETLTMKLSLESRALANSMVRENSGDTKMLEELPDTPSLVPSSVSAMNR